MLGYIHKAWKLISGKHVGMIFKNCQVSHQSLWIHFKNDVHIDCQIKMQFQCKMATLHWHITKCQGEYGVKSKYTYHLHGLIHTNELFTLAHVSTKCMWKWFTLPQFV